MVDFEYVKSLKLISRRNLICRGHENYTLHAHYAILTSKNCLKYGKIDRPLCELISRKIFFQPKEFFSENVI